MSSHVRTKTHTMARFMQYLLQNLPLNPCQRKRWQKLLWRKNISGGGGNNDGGGGKKAGDASDGGGSKPAKRNNASDSAKRNTTNNDGNTPKKRNAATEKKSPNIFNTPHPPKDPPADGTYEPEEVNHTAFQAPDFLPCKIFRPFTHCTEQLGPCASKHAVYKNPEYYAYHRYSFAETQQNAMRLRQERLCDDDARCILDEDIEDSCDSADEQESCTEDSQETSTCVEKSQNGEARKMDEVKCESAADEEEEDDDDIEEDQEEEEVEKKQGKGEQTKSKSEKCPTMVDTDEHYM